MKVISTNIAAPTEIVWKGRKQVTGIYKDPKPNGIYLTAEGVRGDTIGNPKVHGDRQKACYLFEVGEYRFWKTRYPDLNWGFGMFGENLSVEGLDEAHVKIGSVYRAGEVLIKMTAPREPCFKLGIRFGDQKIIDHFVERGKPGAYCEVLEAGWIRPGAILHREYLPEKSLSIEAFYSLLYAGTKDQAVLKKALELPELPAGKRALLERWVRS